MNKKEKRIDENLKLNNLHLENNCIYLYTDGSRQAVDNKKCESVTGAYLILEGTTVIEAGKISSKRPELTKMWNVGGEMAAACFGFVRLLQIKNNLNNEFYSRLFTVNDPQMKINPESFSKVVVVSDYSGVKSWTTKEWKLPKDNPYITKLAENIYPQFGDSVEFVHVCSHTTVKNHATMYNYIVDTLAGENLTHDAPINRVKVDIVKDEEITNLYQRALQRYGIEVPTPLTIK